MSDLKAMSIEQLREKANALGIAFHPSLGQEKLIERIEIQLENQAKESVTNKEKATEAAKGGDVFAPQNDSAPTPPKDEEPETPKTFGTTAPTPEDFRNDENEPVEPPADPDEDAVETAQMPPEPFVEETLNQMKARLYKDQMRLSRVVIHCNDAEKTDWVGEIFKVGNDIVGSFTKYVPFDNEEGYHVPQILLDTLHDKICQKWKTVKMPSGESVKKSFTVPAYTITVLEDLTPDELKKLAADQKARGAID